MDEELQLAANSKYDPDSYICILFDRRGSRIGSKSVDSYLNGIAEGQRILKENVAHSFAVARVLYNSETPDRERYDPPRKPK